MEKNNAIFCEVTCCKAHKKFHARYDKAYDGKWVLTYGITKKSESDHTDSEENKMEIDLSNSRTGPQYKCPYCGNRHFVRCRCGKLTCYSDNGHFTCEYCGHSGKVSGFIENLTGTSEETQL